VQSGPDSEDDTWYVPPIMHHRIHPLNEYSTSHVEPVPGYVEDARDDPLAGPHQDDLPTDGSEDEMWVNLGIAHRSVN
jgi:hypothetical protein